MKQVQEHVAGRRHLAQQQLHRVGWALPRLPQGDLAQPFGKRLAAALGCGLDRFELVDGEPGTNGLVRKEARLSGDKPLEDEADGAEGVMLKGRCSLPKPYPWPESRQGRNPCLPG